MISGQKAATDIEIADKSGPIGLASRVAQQWRGESRGRLPNSYPVFVER
jgi:hypothetical protein